MANPLRILALLLLACTTAPALDGTVEDTIGNPLPYCYVALLNPSFGFVADATTDTNGHFDLGQDTAPGFLVVQPPAQKHSSGMQVFKHQPRIYQLNGRETTLALLNPSFGFVADATTDTNGHFDLGQDTAPGFLVVQPPAQKHSSGMQVFKHQPRIYQLNGRETTLALKHPEVVNLILEGYDKQGNLMRWADYEALGKTGGQFTYATDLDDIMVPATIWPVHGTLTGSDSGPREQGLPSLLIEPGQLARIHLLFWESGYGKLLLHMDNAGKGYQLNKAGDALVLQVNQSLAQRALQALEDTTQTVTKDNADALLAQALQQRDEQQFLEAQARIPMLRQGTLELVLAGPQDAEVSIEVKQIQRDFLFGAYEGSPYNGRAWKIARDAGFDLATVLLGWNWTENPIQNRSTIDRTFGISALDKLGYTIKAHGVVWMQDYGIMPPHAYTLPHDVLQQEILQHESTLLDIFGESIDIWEAINEPAATNAVKLPAATMHQLLANSAAQIRDAGRPTLVNSPHELSYGAKYFLHNTDNTLAQPYATTYLQYLENARAAGALENIDTIGIQFYPGYHLNASFGNLEGPAFTPAYMMDTIHRFARFGKPIHITEFSIPSTYGSDWNSGYWREPWTESIQADYAEQLFTLAYANPHIGSITWWDIMDTKPAVISGGLANPDGSPKESLTRIQALLQQWWTDTTTTAQAGQTHSIPAWSGRHQVTVTQGSDTLYEAEVNLMGGWTKTLQITIPE